MAERKLIAGAPIRRLRRRAGLSQAAMAEMLGISPSYLNLVERNHRPVSATLLVALAEQFDFDPRTLAAAEPGGGAAAIRRRLADPMFADLEVDRAEVDEWLAAAPGGAEAFARAFDRAGGGEAGVAVSDPVAEVRREVERWRNHFGDLDALAESLADDLRLAAADLYGAMIERLRVRHGLSLRILPVDVLAGTLRRLDLHARQLQLSEALDHPARCLAVAVELARLEARTEIEALARGAGFADRVAERLMRRHLAEYFARAVLMPYARFLRACEGSGYDLDLLTARFGTGFEDVAHRLTTLGRVGARGLPVCLIRIDRAGQASYRFAGPTGAPMVAAAGRCPLWQIHHAFDRPGTTLIQRVELEDGTRWLTLSRAVAPPAGAALGVAAGFAIGLALPVEQAGGLAAARGLDLGGPATPIGLGCRACLRADCPQRSAPPAGRALLVNDREQRASAYDFAGD
ncbi:transcriptional regulator [Sphingomonas metalli]|uniref:Transcriptional regulator n=1 Tax=Sphingomonas metalli TaxID=1779358 RepID=A0A916SZ79_9SPHN|nr:helix-turn-helix transcriptional regulator [Sphingomonas metalli]GGB20324.1 transcriptional regulator [Sphingomonas metalli]